MSQTTKMPPKIVMYTRPDCPAAARAAAIMKERGLSWDEVDIDADADANAQVIAWTGRAVTPTLWIGDVMLTEPDAAEIDDALVRAA